MQALNIDKGRIERIAGLAEIDPITSLPNASVSIFIISPTTGFIVRRFRMSMTYVNVIKDVMKLCDCASDAGPRIADDVGIVFGTDIVAIEKASLDLVIEKEGFDVFEKAHHKSPLFHIQEAEKQGLGSMEYELERV